MTHPRMKKAANLVRVKRLKDKVVSDLLDLPSPDSDTEGSSVDHNDHPPIPIRSGVQDIESLENEGGSIRYEDED